MQSQPGARKGYLPARARRYVSWRWAVLGLLLAYFSSPSLLTARLVSASGAPGELRGWMNPALSPEKRADLLLRAMTLDEKITMVHGVSPIPIPGYVGYVPPNPTLSIPALRLADGRAGVGSKAKDVTLLPAPIAVAASFDTALIHLYGQVLGDEQWRKGTNVSLAPSIDVVRVPEWGRTFESYGEDPYLNARMAVAEIRGIQSQGPIADANMYLTMNQEKNRFMENSIIDQRTLHEQPRKNGEPPCQLRGFQKVVLKPRQTRQVDMALDRRSFAFMAPRLIPGSSRTERITSWRARRPGTWRSTGM